MAMMYRWAAPAATFTRVACAVSKAVFQSIAAGLAACCVFAKSVNASLKLVDVGIAHPTFAIDDSSDAPPDDNLPLELPQRDEAVDVLCARVARGTADMVVCSAMQEDQVAAALQTGRDVADAATRSRAASGGAGATLLCVGEIGIGNTTAAAALLAGLTGASQAHLHCKV